MVSFFLNGKFYKCYILKIQEKKKPYLLSKAHGASSVDRRYKRMQVTHHKSRIGEAVMHVVSWKESVLQS